MKKLMGISVIAALAVLPVAANAAEGDQVTKLNAAAAVSSQNLATTSYVQGAYKAAADKIDAVIDSTSIATNGTYIDAGKDVAHNLGELDTAAKNNADAISTETTARQNADTAINNNIGTMSELATEATTLVGAINEVRANSADAYQLKANSTVADGTYNYIQQGTGVATNLVNLDTRAKANADAIAAEELRATTAEGTLTNLTTETKTNLVAAINEVDAHADTNATNIANEITRATNAEGVLQGNIDTEATARQNADTAINNTIGTKANLNTTDKTDLVSAINEVNTAVSTLDSNAAATYQTLANSNVAADGNHITAGQGVGNNLVALDDAVEVIENKQIPIVSDWSTGNVTQKKISELVTYVAPVEP